MPDWVISLFTSGRVADIAIAVLIIETALLYRMRRGALRPLLFNAASGISLMLALRTALTDPTNYIMIAAWLLLGFATHIGDVFTRK